MPDDTQHLPRRFFRTAPSPALIEALEHVLGETWDLSQTTRCLSWNLVGPGSVEAERCLDAQTEEMARALLKIARRIRALGLTVRRPDIADPMDVDDPADIGAVLTELSRRQAGLGLSICAALDVARAEDDHVTRELLVHRLSAQQDHARCLRQLSGAF